MLWLVFAANAFSLIPDEQIKEILIKQSIQSYPGSCPCPYSTDHVGRKCGHRSAWYRRGGSSPLCYPSDINPQMIKEYNSQKM